MRIDITKKQESDVMYSAVGYKANGTDLEVVQNGMVGALGNLQEYDTYKFLPLASGNTEVFIMATPEIDADESKISNNTLHGYTMVEGQVGDITVLKRHTCVAIEAAGIDNLPASNSTAVGKYVYATEGKRLLQYKATLPDVATDKAILIGVIENVKAATAPIMFKQGVAGATGLSGMGLSYNLVEVRFI